MIYLYYGDEPVATIHLIWSSPSEWLLDRIEIVFPPTDVPAFLKRRLTEALFQNGEEVLTTGGILAETSMHYFESIRDAILSIKDDLPLLRILWPADLPTRTLEQGVV